MRSDIKPLRFKPWMVAGLAIITIVAVLVILAQLPAVRYWGADEITRAALDTERKLAVYERSGNSDELHDWLINGPKEALGQQIYFTLGHWSIAHQKEFIQLAESLNTEQQEQFVEMLALTLDDSGQSDEFRQAFKGSKSAVILAITRRLGRSVPWSDYMANPSKYDSSSGAKK